MVGRKANEGEEEEEKVNPHRIQCNI